MGTPVTQEQIDKWIEEHGDVHEVAVSMEPVKFDPHILQEEDIDKVETVKGYIKTPTDRILNFALQSIAKPVEAGSIILKNCWLGGDVRILNDKSYLTSAAMQCLEFVEIRQAKVKKLSKPAQK